MGVIYKLKTEIKDFILERKKGEPKLSCRQLSALTLDKFQIKVSKSSINFMIKNAGLSMPVGRRRTKRRRKCYVLPQPQEEIKLLAPPALEVTPEAAIIEEQIKTSGVEFPSTGAILLKAVDSLTGGTARINQLIARQLNIPAQESLAKTEALLYGALTTDLSSYLNELQRVGISTSEIVRIISEVFQEIRCLKIDLSDKSSFYLDAQFYTVWSTPQIPFDFSTTIYNIKNYINKSLQKGHPLALFTAPGYDTPTEEFFDFILSLEAREIQMLKLTLYNHKFEEIEVIPIEGGKSRFFIFGLWPWQFGQFRRGKIKGDFKPFYFEPLKKEYYLANIEMELLQPKVNKRVTLTGTALKSNLAENIRLIILSNFSPEVPAEEIANLYLSRWPNLEEAFQDFSRKIELFTYTASSQRVFSLESLNLPKEAPAQISQWFDLYLKGLDMYVRWHFLPSGYEDKDFTTINARFYRLETRLEKQKDRLLVTFLFPSGYSYLMDLEYTLRRFNERDIVFPDSKRLWCRV